MKRPSKVINGRSSSKTRHAAAVGQVGAEKITAQKVKFASLHEDEEEEDDDEAAKRLRKNPKKTSKVSTSKNVVIHQQKFVCHKCGKAFQSSKAMCGHMACHSEKEKPSSYVVSKKKMLMIDSDSNSESEGGAGQMRRRSRRTRYMKHDYVADSKVKLDLVNNCSSEASGIEQEQEEVAICLMMLSRDYSNWGGLNSIGDSSDNNSVVLEDRSISAKLGKKDGLSCEYDLNKEKYQMNKMELLGDFDSGYVRKGSENAVTDVKIRNLGTNKFEEDSKFEPHLSLKKLKTLMDGEGYIQIQRPNMESYLGKLQSNETDGSGPCKRVELHFQSHQPFDVNAARNKQFPAAFPYLSGGNSFQTDAYHNMLKGKGILNYNSGNVDAEWKKGKTESPVCSKSFRPSYELTYHQSVHLAEGSEDIKCDQVPANFKRISIPSHDLIDLNLPAPMEDEEVNESLGSY